MIYHFKACFTVAFTGLLVWDSNLAEVDDLSGRTRARGLQEGI